ncbi:MAG: RelA/SpoT domain-containing protein [Firmicutes bacterium]|nr:RelA/SpoT domain-containing protein [Bacillota bacterium]
MNNIGSITNQMSVNIPTRVDAAKHIKNAQTVGTTELKGQEKKEMAVEHDTVTIDKSQMLLNLEGVSGEKADVKKEGETQQSDSFAGHQMSLLLDEETMYMGLSGASAGELKDSLAGIEHTYPGITERVENLDSRASNAGYSKEMSSMFGGIVQDDKPWSTREFDNGKVKEYIAEKKVNHPELNTTDVDANYDMKKTLHAKGQMVSDLHEMFPQDKFPGVSIAARVKSKDSLAGKLKTKQAQGKNYTIADATDLVGSRVIAANLGDVKGITEAIEQRYGDKILEKINYYEKPNGGYRAIHYIMDRDGVPVELQVCTKDMRVAFDAYHDTVYKQNPNEPMSEPVKNFYETLVDKAMYMDSAGYVGNRDKYRGEAG